VNKVTGDTVNAIHRDVSPHNLILSYEGNLKVIDFGIAKAASGMQEPTRAGTIKGKIAYLSPEQINGQNIDARSDIFALGIVVWEMLTLRRPFHKAGDSDGAIISRIDNCDQHLMPPSLFNAEVPKEVDDVVMKAMKRNPDERYATASDFQMALRQVMMKFFPDYTYADTGKKIRSLFAEEIESERKELRELNLVAQKVVSSHLEASTRVIDSQNQTITATYPGQAGVVTGVMDNLKTIVPGAVNQVDDRLLKIEQLMKQKASGRHYLMLAFYVVSLIALKLDDKYSVFNLLFPQQQVVEERLDEASTDMRPAKSKGQSKKKKGSKSSSSLQGQGLKPKQAQAGLGENM
jgi:serine/threonine protein kinase